MFRYGLFCADPSCSPKARGGGILGDSRWTWGSGGCGMQGGRVGRPVLKISQPGRLGWGTIMLCSVMFLFQFALFCYVMLRSVMVCSVMVCFALFCHVTLCYVLFCSVPSCSPKAQGGGILGDSRWTWGSGGRGMQGGRVDAMRDSRISRWTWGSGGRGMQCGRVGRLVLHI